MPDYLLIGAGGTGSHLALPLHRYLSTYEQDPHWGLFIVDGDHVEGSNLARQMFDHATVGMNKAQALATMINDPNHVHARDTFLGPQNIASLIRNTDTVLIAADNFHVRRLIIQHALTLDDVTIINGGNELISGSVQVFLRRNNTNITPRPDYLHAEFATEDADRSTLSCAQIAELPGGEQTIIANNTVAAMMLANLWRVHNWDSIQNDHQYTEFQFDHRTNEYYGWDVRTTRGWNE